MLELFSASGHSALRLLLCAAFWVALSLSPASAQTPAALPAKAVEAVEPLTFRMLLIVKPVSDIHSEKYLKVQNRMTDEDVRAVTQAFQEWVPEWVTKMTRGRVKWETTTVVSDVPLRSTREWDDGSTVAPEDIGEDMDRFVKQGQYDTIFVYWMSTDAETGYDIPGAMGHALGGTPASALYSGFAALRHSAPENWTPYSSRTETFLHEWIHTLEGFYSGKADVKLPRGGVHAGDNHGYHYSEAGRWRSFYADYFNAQVPEGGVKVGFGEAAWKHGTQRSSALLRPAAPKRAGPPAVSPQRLALDAIRATPEYLTPERRKRNLLVNGDFSLGDNGSWKIESFRGNKLAASIVRDYPAAGKTSIRLLTPQEDDVRLVQTVELKPFTNYVFSGWVSTNALHVVQRGGIMGANLSWIDHFERSRTLLGDNDRQYLVVAFNTRDQTRVRLGSRIGHLGSTVVGSAIFHDLCLVAATD